MVLVYALLDGHPASAACERLIREQAGWFTTSMTLLEVKAVLTKVYGVEATQATEKLTQDCLRSADSVARGSLRGPCGDGHCRSPAT
jgi:predicted nucleic acid-binding protein